MSSESTDNAYVGADSTSVAPKVRGLVGEVLVSDNQTVRVGQPLVRIDAEEFEARVVSARAAVADAEAGVQSAQAALGSQTAEERLSAAQVTASRTAIRSAVAQSDVAAADRRRYAALAATGAVARREADIFSAAAVTSEQDAARARALLAVSQESVGVTTAKRPGLVASLATARAKVGQAQAALDLAMQDRRYATILAPVDGVVGNRQVRPGDYVQPGTRLLTLVPLRALYVTANFKETQTARIRPGLGDDRRRRAPRCRAPRHRGQPGARLWLELLIAAVRAGHRQLHQGRAAGRRAHPVQSRAAWRLSASSRPLGDGEGKA